MVIKPELILERLKELDTIISELSRYKSQTEAEIETSLSRRWTIERGLIAAANLIFDVADHILSGHFGVYPDTYEDSLRLLKEKKVISEELFHKVKGLGGFRNILVHEYLKIDITELRKNLLKSFDISPAYSLEIQQWLKATHVIKGLGDGN
jgi:uncharacterized protein YutE (UPF0331/DUF86 family)